VAVAVAFAGDSGHRLRASSISLLRMDAVQALADLTEISSQIEAAVLFDDQGTVAASTLSDAEAARAFAASAAKLLEDAAAFRSSDPGVTQLEASTQEGSVFVVRDAARLIAATTGPSPTVGLVFYDLKSCLHGAADAADEGTAAKPKPKPRAPRRKKEPVDGEA
jgi:predicted regulator of Ras-like GTPase activity (Roadblock/LC7/MglB family)